MLEQLSAVRCFQWHPRQARLAICTGGGKVYLWSPAGCVSVQVPGEGERKRGREQTRPRAEGESPSQEAPSHKPQGRWVCALDWGPRRLASQARGSLPTR